MDSLNSLTPAVRKTVIIGVALVLSLIAVGMIRGKSIT